MSLDHLEDDELATVCAALRWEPAAWLAHLASCARCSETLRELTRLHDAFGPASVDPTLLRAIEQSISAVRMADAEETPPAFTPLPRTSSRIASLAMGLLTAVTTFATLVTVGTINPLTASGPAPAGVLGLIVGAIVSRAVAQSPQEAAGIPMSS